jgi:predicted PhzF superfamily epimerase YddE/YHI9
MTALWLGRVFLRGDQGGNHTAVVTADVPARHRQAVAAALDVPDTGFVVGSGACRLVLRSHSPSEEIAHCVQTSLAALPACGAAAGERWTVVHEAGSALSVRIDPEDLNVVWACDAQAPAPDAQDSGWQESVPLPQEIAQRLDRSTATGLRTARPRLYVTDLHLANLEAFETAPEQVMRLCRHTGTNGLVLGARVDGGLRVRVFTSSLEGREDVATGGAVLELARLLRPELGPGRLDVTQGPSPARGHLRLHLPRDTAAPIELGAEVRTLSTGTLHGSVV